MHSHNFISVLSLVASLGLISCAETEDDKSPGRAESDLQNPDLAKNVARNADQIEKPAALLEAELACKYAYNDPQYNERTPQDSLVGIPPFAKCMVDQANSRKGTSDLELICATLRTGTVASSGECYAPGI